MLQYKSVYKSKLTVSSFKLSFLGGKSSLKSDFFNIKVIIVTYKKKYVCMIDRLESHFLSFFFLSMSCIKVLCSHLTHVSPFQSYISGQQEIFTKGYYLSGLLNDFIKVYPYAPSFSRNFLHRGLCFTVSPVLKQ